MQDENPEIEEQDDTCTDDDRELESSLLRLTRVPILTEAEERRLTRQIALGGAKAMEAKNRLVEANMRLVVRFVRQYKNQSIPVDDLVTEGAIGLMTAAERFDPSLGFRFSTYAIPWVRQAVNRAVDNTGKTIRLPTHINDSLRKVSQATTTLRNAGIEPTPELIQEKTKISVKRQAGLNRVAPDPVSLNAHAQRGSVAEAGDEFIDFIADKTVRSPEEIVLADSVNETITDVLSVLDANEQAIMLRRFQITDDEDSGVAALGWSKERIRAVETAALRKLRAHARHQKVKELCNV